MWLKRNKKYSYTVMLAASFLIAGLFLTGTLELNDHEKPEFPFLHSEPEKEETQIAEQTPPENEEPVLPEEPKEETPPETEVPEGIQPVIRQADRSYFDDALFIGDSRTMGLYEYGDLGEAVVIADSGMSVYKVWEKEIKAEDGSIDTLQTLLNKRTFGKVYIMLGINELGYAFEPTAKKFEELVETIRQTQPEAIIYLEANLHITKEKSDSSDIFNNENINRFNKVMEQLADGKQIFYLDVNPLFDNEEGCLSPDYTTDKVHVLGKYYADWVDWILENAVFYEVSNKSSVIYDVLYTKSSCRDAHPGSFFTFSQKF